MGTSVPAVRFDHFERAGADIGAHGDNDTIPFDIENRFVQKSQKKLAALAFEYFQALEARGPESARKAIDALNVFSERLLVPVGPTGFRVTTKIHPFWNLYFNGLGIAIAEQLEPQRSDRVHSYQTSRTTLSNRLRYAGLSPVSGPEIDGVSTYVFRRSDVDSLDMKAVIDTPYVSPAGRKKKTERLALDTFLSRRQAVAALNLHSRQLRIVVKDGWIAPLAISALHWRFKTDDVAALAEKLRTEYRSLDDARQATGQSLAEFRRTWIFTGYAAERRFGNQRLISVADLERIVVSGKKPAFFLRSC
jgi:hypothetical protein